MATKENPRKQEFIAAVQKHMAEHGSKNWNLVLDAFPDIKQATKWRWMREAKGAPPRVEDISNARERLVQSVKKFPTTNRGERLASKLDAEAGPEIIDNLPAAPSPAFIARKGDEGLRTIDFVAEIQSLYRDASMLRAYAVKKRMNPDTGEEVEAINNPAAFDKSIVRRADLLETAIRAVQGFYETIIDEIGKESPDCQRRIMERLQVLNARHGMTLNTMRV